jgi:hypothetical protein
MTSLFKTILYNILYALFFLLLANYTTAQVILHGSVLDIERQPIANASIFDKETGRGTTTNAIGAFELTLPLKKIISLRIEAIGFEAIDTIVSTNAKRLPPFSIMLNEKITEIEEVAVISTQKQFATLEHINLKTISAMSASSLGLENLIKTLPGVQSTNELSSQYSVRGGTFDENLVYIDGSEVYRPTLIRSGNQEGLSVVNPDMVEKLTFSAGGFPAYFGDKMSSVLNIQYRTPKELAAQFQLGLLENRLLLEGATPNQQIGAMLGIRYKTTQLLLNTTETKGDYKPSFLDIQSKISYKISDNLSLNFLASLARNSYRFIPKVKKTQVGTLTGLYKAFMVYYEGQEEDQYNTSLANLTLKYTPSSDWKIQFATNAYHTSESEAFDILGEYWLQNVQADNKSINEVNDSLANFGIGGALDHARNYFHAWVAGGKINAQYSFSRHNLQLGISAYEHRLTHSLSEWHIIDSAGYTLPRRQLEFDDQNTMKAEGDLRYLRLAAYTNLHLNYNFWAAQFELDLGLRFSTRDVLQTPRLSPRFALTYTPDALPTFSCYFASGIYYQYPFYREMRAANGELFPNLLPQRAIHYILGTRWSFPVLEHPFRIQLEFYKKDIAKLIPYNIENLSLRYEAANIAEGYIHGIDLKIHGELVPGAESWLSLSLLSAKMRFTDSPRNPLLTPTTNSYFAMPSDQRFAISLFLQDYLPSLPSYTVNLTAHYASGLPFTPPHSPYGTIGRLPAYKRIDIGFEKEFKSQYFSETWLRKAKWLKEFRIGIEVLNLLDFANTSSYLWVAIPSEQGNISRLAVPNYLTTRCINFRVRLGF